MKRFVVSIAVVALAGSVQAELFENGDFEAGAWSGGGSGSGSSAGGTYFAWTSMPASLQATGGSDGGQWTQLDTSASDQPGWFDTWGWAWSGIWNSNIVPASSGDEFTVSGMARHISLADTLRAFVAYMDAGGNRVDYDGNGVVDNDDRYMPTWTVGGEWAPFSDDFTVPSVDLLGNAFAAPIERLDVTFSVETEAAIVGIDELSLIPEPMTISLLGLGLGILSLRRRKA